MTDVESDAGLLDADPRAVPQRVKRKTLSRFKKISKTDSTQETEDTAHEMSEVETTPNGESSTDTKHKHRTKLWESFLQKTRKIRVRTKDKNRGFSTKLEKRAISHPNISSFSSVPSSPDTSDKAFTLINGIDDRLRHVGDITADSKRDKFRQQRDTTYTRSSVSLNDSACDPHISSSDKMSSRFSAQRSRVSAQSSRVSFQHSDATGDDGYRSSHDHSMSKSNTASPKSPDIMSTEDSPDRFSSFDIGEDKDADDEDDGDEQEDVPVIEQDTLQVRDLAVLLLVYVITAHIACDV